jgi:hypothetical protein
MNGYGSHRMMGTAMFRPIQTMTTMLWMAR